MLGGRGAVRDLQDSLREKSWVGKPASGPASVVSASGWDEPEASCVGYAPGHTCMRFYQMECFFLTTAAAWHRRLQIGSPQSLP